ncbi:Rho termination factor N-terminal domain-containing protein [Poseidonibacter lekithochrous]|uniref:Rho termination factor N-terminal domain-containing protein n=1 Tax=Poseidonibacter lekithochrous TaxID=1904463 RepID=UPI000D3A7A5A|nr:Rho termination factor N-terminal domain-containing protein [Poseidonibacter lekithochrous]
MKVVVIRSTVYDGKDIVKGSELKIVDGKSGVAKDEISIAAVAVLERLGKVEIVEDETDIDVIEDNTTPIEKMKKDELLAYAGELEIEVDDGMTKAEIIEAINASEEE